jgi:hypothetical protein
MNTRLSVFLIAGFTALLAVAPACADPGDGRFARRFWLRSDEAQSARAERFERRREFQERESAYVRMSPEERRQLRHDIRAAREDVYRRQPPPPPPLPPGLHEGPPR